jgi:nucleotide-binding universal stress UspA family protein
MTYKSILVHVDTDRRCPQRVEYAASLAAQYGAHLVGLFVQPPLRLPGYVRAEMGEDVLALHRAAEEKVAAGLRRAFDDAAGRTSPGGREFRSGIGDPIATITLHARYADLVVVGQHDPDDDTATATANFPELAAMHAGRPVLVVPYAGRFDPAPKHVLISWNASREASRAATDALPFLRAAKQVTALAINPRTGAEAHGEVPAADVALWLSRHGVKAEAMADPAVQIDIGNYLLSRAADLSVDMIVMGAYGHARMRELVFGGVTQTIMREMTVPVLLSH